VRKERAVQGGYNDNYQRDHIDLDDDYTTSNPLENQNVENDYSQDHSESSRGRGGGRGRGNPNHDNDDSS